MSTDGFISLRARTDASNWKGMVAFHGVTQTFHRLDSHPNHLLSLESAAQAIRPEANTVALLRTVRRRIVS
ncbi:hypothetical protein GCM10010981_24280 [Dyella nitratireducens]|uniref:Uncharacterized protein n=1 Tax=Dyella nitratireducens TaxID=1849580 RepID=A0ABQ1FZC3_9GAMM|nr:hypothetical protein GCM10010981_24280 [Dyella nitratireducens]GLQ40862.1 hypothetical protein GCM10007902_07120 [Dyella nitratireducens]